MDTVWIDTMFPGIDEEAGWKENLERVVNYDYLLKEYLDWQLKHLTVDNFDATDWANVTADLIHMASEYTDNAVEAAASLTLETAKEYTRAELAAQYGTVSGDIADAVAEVKLYADAIESSINIGAYYNKNEVDSLFTTSEATMTAYADAIETRINIGAYYTSSQVDSAISAQAALSQTAAETYTNTQLGSYYTKSEIGDFTGYQTAVAAMQAYADAAVASIDLTAYYTSSQVDSAISTQAGLTLAAAEAAATAELSAKVGNIGSSTVKAYTDGLISGLSLAATGSGSSAKLVLQSGGSTIANSGASLTLSASNNSGGYSTLSLKAGNVTLATSGNITLGGSVVFAGDNISRLNNNSGYQTSSGVTTIIGNTVDTGYVNALNVTAKTVKASASISAPEISGGYIEGADIVGCYIYAAMGNWNNYMRMESDGFTVVTGGYIRARLYQSGNEVTLRLGDTNQAYVQKYYSSGTNYMWVGGSVRGSGGVGIRFDLDAKSYKIFGTAE